MDSGAFRKRPWEDDSSAMQQSSRRASIAASDQPEPPLPHLSGWHARDSWDRDHHTLPPIYPPSCGVSDEHAPAQLLHALGSHFGADGSERPKLRSQSLFDIHQPKRPRIDYTGEPRPSLDLYQDPQSFTPTSPGLSDPRHSDRYPQSSCCSLSCQGRTCISVRSVIQKLASELIALDLKVRYILRSDSHAPREPPDSETIGTERSLHWALDLVQWNGLQLRDYAERLVNPTFEQDFSRSQSTALPASHDITKRVLSYPEIDEHSPASRLLSTSMSDYPRLPPPTNMPEETRRTLYGSEYSSGNHSPRGVTSSYSRAPFAPPQSPLQSSHMIQAGMLPSPSSMNFPASSILPPISPPQSHSQSAAQASHLQDLQHQVSIKTLAFQTLQREYDSLLQKLERQRTKCATLEKKFEVSDLEINSLTDEKEKLQAQIASFEAQVEDLQQSRDEARRQLVANGAQYMRIMDMASRLQAQGAEDRRRWEVEKSDLEKRIKTLEEAMVTGSERSDASHRSQADEEQLASAVPTGLSGQMFTSATSAETVVVLRAEIARLRARTQSLENALQIMRDESLSIQAAAQTIVASGGKLKEVVDSGLAG